MSRQQDWVTEKFRGLGILNTKDLPKELVYDWMTEYNKEFGTYVESETFKRYLREARVTIEKEGVIEVNSLKIVPPAKGVGNILVIPDLHEPYTRKGFLEFCKEIKDKHDCTEVVFLGDIGDGHTTSRHQTDPDAPYSGIGELNATRERIARWHETFPNAKVCIGNHDTHPNRKMFNEGISASWLRPIGEVLNTPTWTYSDEFIINDVKFIHGIGRNAKTRCQNEGISIVQGHFHSASYIEFFVGIHHRLFAMQLGAGIDDKSFAFAYAKHFAKTHINCGVIKDNGKLPIIEYMDLDRDYTK